MRLLLSRCNEFGTGNVLRSATKWGQIDAVELLLKNFPFGKLSVANALLKAVESAQYEAAKLLTEKFPDSDEMEPHGRLDGLPIETQDRLKSQTVINYVLRSAAGGYTVIVKALVERFSSVPIGPLLLAVEKRQYEPVKLLLRSNDSSILPAIGNALHNAATCGDTMMAEILVNRSRFLDIARALNIAVSRNDPDMVQVLAVKHGESYKVDTFELDALVRAATSGRKDLVEILINNSNSRTKEEAILLLSSIENGEVLSSFIESWELKTFENLFTDAAARGLAGLVQQLMCRVNLNSIRRSLVAAALNGHSEVIKKMLDKSDLPNADEVLEAMAKSDYKSVVKLLRNGVATDNLKSSNCDYRNKKPRLK